jgi:hypothetical protein
LAESTDSATAAKKLWEIYDKFTEDEVASLNGLKEDRMLRLNRF